MSSKPTRAKSQGIERPTWRAALSTPTAVFCYNDMTAVGVLKAARQAGLSVPGDLALVGFDDIPLASYVHPSLTTIAQPKAQMGRQAVEMVLALISHDGPHGGGIANVVVEGQLIVRESSVARPAALATADRFTSNSERSK
jgi:LacI family transcriptional regulator